MITIILLVLIVVFSLFQYWIHFGRMGKIIEKMPGPPTVPFFGNLLSFQLSTESLFTMVRALNKEYYPIYRLWAFMIPNVAIRHPDDAEVVLSSTKHIEKGIIYRLLHPWFNTGLLTSTGAKWQKRRKILTPAFHFNVLQQFVDIFVEQGQQMTESLKRNEGPIVVDLVPLISEHTLNAICETAMGTSLEGKGAFQFKYRKAVHEMGKVLVYRLVRPWLYSSLTFFLTRQGRIQSKLLEILQGFTTKIIAERQQYHDQTGGRYLKGLDSGENVTEDNGKKEDDVGIRKRRLAMLDLLIAASRNGNQIDDQGIREEVDTFMFEGHDTTGMGICFCLMLLAEHKEIQDRCRTEVDTVLQEHDGKMSMSMLQNLPYLERCIKESLRLYPSVPFIGRHANEDLQLKNYLIPGGSEIHIHIYDVHRDPNFWPNPSVFDPDRFLPEKIQGRHPYSYIPFSAGPRNCVGQRFAMLEMKALISSLLHKFNLEPVDRLQDVRMVCDLVLRPAHPIRIRFVPLQSS